MSFDAFGKRRETNWAAMTNEAVATFDTSRTKRGFTGHEMIDPVGLVHMNGRVYEPEVGRFVSADPIVQDIENLQAYNRYTYVQNNPLTLTDPSGFYAVDDFSGPGSYSSPNFLLMNDTASKVDLNTKSNLGMSSAPLRSNTDQETSGISSFRQSMQEQAQIRGATDSTASEMGIFRNSNDHSSFNAAREKGVQVAFESHPWLRATVPGQISWDNAVTAYEQGHYGYATLGVAAMLAEQTLFVVTLGQSFAASKTTQLGTTVAVKAESEVAETFYRTMSKADYDNLLKTGKLTATAETFISPTKAFSQSYRGVLVEFSVKPGTLKALENIGVRNMSRITSEAYPNMSLVSKGWANSKAFFKGEGAQINIGLGRGEALDVFNRNISSFKK